MVVTRSAVCLLAVNKAVLIHECIMPQAWRQKEKERLQQEQEEALRQMLKNTNEEERDRILADFHDHTRRLERRHDDQKQQQQDKLKAKLAARKRLDQQLDRDKAVNRELDHITKEHVSLGF